MKKIIFAALSVLMMLSLVGCGEHLVDFKVIDLSNGAVPGDWAVPANWSNTTPFTSVDKDNNTYTFEFTVKDEAGSEVGFKILTESGNWDCAGYTEFNVTVDGGAVDAKFIDNCGPAGNAFIKGITGGKTYKMTVVCNADSSASVKVESMEDPVYPTPFYLDGYFVCGAMNSWTQDKTTIIYGANLDVVSGEVTYVYKFAASAAEHEFGICTPDWGSKYTGATFAVGTDDDFVETTLGADANNKITGLTVGGNYQMTIKTTSEGEVLFFVEEIAAITVKFKIINLENVTEAWINGEFWGSWATGWPLSAWGGKGEKFKDVDAVEVVDGVAEMPEDFDFETIAKNGETISKAVKFVATNDDWETTAYDNPNISVSFEVTGAGTYLVTIDAAANTASVEKQ